MSLILDALRKSEAERQRGKSPGLFASTPGLPIPLRERLRLWPVLVFLLLLLASAAVIWRGESRRAQREAEAVAAVVPNAVRGVEVGDALSEAPASAAVAFPPQPVAMVATPSAAAPSTAPPPTPPTPPTVAASRPPAIPAPSTQVTPPAPAITLSASPPPAAPAESPAEEALPSVAVLDTATRASLPPLKLSMHVFGQDPAKRFAIIDGKRVSEGSLLGSGVVEAIRRDGVVVNINGQRVLVPKP